MRVLSIKTEFLLLSPIHGLLLSFLVFFICFLFIHIVKLIKFGWLYKKQNVPKKQSLSPKKEEKPPDPIYYLVERKKPRKTPYKKPKEIRFK